MKISDKIRKIVVWIFIVLFWILVLSIVGYYCYRAWFRNQVHDYYIMQTQTSKFDDFSSIEDDFKTIADIAFEYKVAIQSSKQPCLSINVDEDENAVYVSTYELDIELNEKQKKAVKNVYYVFWNKGIASILSFVSFINSNDDLLFWGEDGRYGIVYCLSDSPNVEDIEGYMGEDAGIVKLSDCWYQVIRHPDN